MDKNKNDWPVDRFEIRPILARPRFDLLKPIFVHKVPVSPASQKSSQVSERELRNPRE